MIFIVTVPKGSITTNLVAIHPSSKKALGVKITKKKKG